MQCRRSDASCQALLPVGYFHFEQRRTERLAVRVKRQRSRDTTAKRLVQDEIESANSRQFVTFDPTLHDIGEMRLDACRRHMLREERIVPRLVRDDRNVGHIALVASAGVSEFPELHGQVTSYDTLVLTSLRGNRVETAAITRRADFHAPPPPAGPLSHRVSTSLPMRIASFSVSVRPATRMRASGNSAPLPTSGPQCTLLTPMISRRSSVVAPAVFFRRSSTICSASLARARAPGPP